MSWPEEEEVAHNQLALRADDDAPLLSPTQALSRRVSAGTTRRRGCGVCRACLFMPHRKARPRERERAGGLRACLHVR
jgi:hypothetical protein